jgi:hypothetical protein
MIKHQALAVGLIVFGVLANNYIYLHDILLDKHFGEIFLGRASMFAAGASLIPIVAGLLLIARAPGTYRRKKN